MLASRKLLGSTHTHIVPPNTECASDLIKAYDRQHVSQRTTSMQQIRSLCSSSKLSTGHASPGATCLLILTMIQNLCRLTWFSHWLGVCHHCVLQYVINLCAVRHLCVVPCTNTVLRSTSQLTRVKLLVTNDVWSG